MKKALIATLVCAILLCGIILFAAAEGEKPFENLSAEKIVSATVRLTPPDKVIRINDTAELAKYLKAVVIYEKDNSYTEYSGQGVTFTLTMTDGTETQVMAYNPFIVIDGVGYKAEYAPCEALSAYANHLLDESSVVILEQPPVMTVISGETVFEALCGTYSWQLDNGDGTSTGIEACGAHPLDCKDILTQFEIMEQSVVLRFTEEPDEILSVRCWSDEHWSDNDAESEEVTLSGNEIELKPGGYIYEVKAKWKAENGNGGTAYYSFYLNLTK